MKKRTPLAYDPKHALNAICPYYTMFPLEYPLRILRKHKKTNPVVCDPFCGRGTTIYAARHVGLPCWGVDTSPIAVAIAKAKLASATLENIMALASELVDQEPEEVPASAFFGKAYAPKTLLKLCALREGLHGLETETDEAILLRAAALGCLHGPRSKNVASAGYFSNQMPRTFASKPDYSVQYWKQRGLKAPEVDVLKVLRRKLSRIGDLEAPGNGAAREVSCSDARSITFRKSLRKRTSVVITSPPYYGMRTYVQDQWLRLWFLGGPDHVDYRNEEQLNHGGHDAFIEDLATVWQRIRRSHADRIDLYVRFGAISSARSDAREILKSSLEEADDWTLISVRNAESATSGKRQADQMGRNSNAATEYDFHAVSD